MANWRYGEKICNEHLATWLLRRSIFQRGSAHAIHTSSDWFQCDVKTDSSPGWTPQIGSKFSTRRSSDGPTHCQPEVVTSANASNGTHRKSTVTMFRQGPTCTYKHLQTIRRSWKIHKITRTLFWRWDEILMRKCPGRLFLDVDLDLGNMFFYIEGVFGFDVNSWESKVLGKDGG